MNGNGKIALLAIAVIAVGTFALPNTMSLFSGQHTWYKLNGTSNLKCEKCHADVIDELENSAFHTDFDRTSSASNGDCYGCHRTNESITYANVSSSVSDTTAGTKAHAASTVACMVCHDVNQSSYPKAGGFNISDSSYNYTNETAGYTGEAAAHNQFIKMAISKTEMKDSNEACIACHTHIRTEINWTHRYSLEFNATPEFELPPTHFNVTNWSVNGTNKTRVTGEPSGSGSAEYLGTG